MNILIVHNRYQIPGGEDTVFEQEEQLLRQNGHRVFCYERTNAELNDMSRLQKLTVPFSMIYSFQTARAVQSIIQKEKMELVHVHNTLFRVSPSVYYAALKELVPVVQTIHNFRMICPNGLCYRDGHICEDCAEKGLHCAVKHSCYRNSRLQTIASVLCMKIHRMTGIYQKLHYICLTEFNKKQLMKQGQIREEQIFIKPNSTGSQESLIPFSKRKDQILFAGRLEESKGILFLLDVWKKMDRHPYQLKIYGSGPLEELCRERIQKENMTDIQLCGRIEHERLLEVIGESKALILPTQWYEGFPMSLLEAMSKGTPILVPDLGNAGSITVNGVNGYKYEPNNLEDGIRAIHENLDINDSVYAYFMDHYSEETNYQMLMDIYQKVKVKQ